MKKFLYMAVAAIAALSSCTSDEDAVIDNGGSDTNAPVFTATIESGAATRTQLVEGSTAGQLTKVNWLSSDKVGINDAVYAVTPGATDATTAILTNESATAPTGTFKAIYPASLYNNGTYELPATQTYEANKFNAPMYAESTETSLAFKNICSVLAIKVTSADIAQLKSIAITADKGLCGEFTINTDDPTKPYAKLANDNSKTVTLMSSTVLDLTEAGTTFYIAIPAQEYMYLNIYLSADGSTYKEAMATKIKLGIGDIARNTIYTIDYAKNAVQLWKSGPFFATANVDVSETNKRGVMRPWTDAAKTGGDFMWGANWKCPSQAEMYNLVSYTTSSYGIQDEVYGFTLTSTYSGYEGTTLFLCAKDGQSAVGGAPYWTSTPNGTSQANELFLVYENSNVSCSWYAKTRTDQYYVRPILVEGMIPEASNTLNGHEYVEIGGKKWATMNVGATSVADNTAPMIVQTIGRVEIGNSEKIKSCYGTYFIWGETVPNTTAYTSSNMPTLNACDNPTLCSDHDAATANWGTGWRTPTRADFQALYAACGGASPKSPSSYSEASPQGIYWLPKGTTIAGTTYGVNGMLFVQDATHQVFFPAAGRMKTSSFDVSTYIGYYWSSTLDAPNYTSIAYNLKFEQQYSANPNEYSFRYYGFPVRAVAD